MYDELVKRLRFYQSGTLCYKEAADAIEELSADCDMYRKGMTDEHNKAARLLWNKEHCWIPVAERLPEEDGCYLVAVKNDHQRRYSKTAWFSHGSCSWFARQDVTHWMPLPEPPKEDEHGSLH